MANETDAASKSLLGNKGGDSDILRLNTDGGQELVLTGDGVVIKGLSGLGCG